MAFQGRRRLRPIWQIADDPWYDETTFLARIGNERWPASRFLECSFLIPICRDRNLADGEPHDLDAWNWLFQEMAVFRGGTRAIELYEGWYVDPDPDERVVDLCRRYMVAIPRKDLRRLRNVLRKACRVFSQKCIYLSVAGHVEFVEE